MRVGYVRVSSIDQNTVRQLDGIAVQRTFTDTASGKDTARPKLAEMLAFVRDGDVVIVHSMDRLARNLEDLRRTVRTLTGKGVRVEFVKENLTFTGEDSPMATLLLSVMGAFAEFERALILERQRGGIAAAKARGVYTGRKPALSPEQAHQLRERAQAGERKSALASEFGISRETVYSYLRTAPGGQVREMQGGGEVHSGVMDAGDNASLGCGCPAVTERVPDRGEPSSYHVRSSCRRIPVEDLVRLCRAKDQMDRDYAQPLDVAALACGALMSTGHFSRSFRAAFGESPYSYLMTRRIERAKALLRRGDLTVTEVCLEVGATSLGSFSSRFTELVGIPPSEYRASDHSWGAGVPPCLVKQLTRPVRNGEAKLAAGHIR